MQRTKPAFMFLMLISLLFGAACSAQAQTSDGLAAPDTSSPRATLETFLDSVDTFMELSLDATLSYAASNRSYQNEREKRLNDLAELQFVNALETLDLSELPSGFRRVLAIESLVRMTDVIARIDIPDLSDVPDHEMMKDAGETSWRIPNTRIEISLVLEGARAGEYLFSGRTVANLAVIHQRVVDHPPIQVSVKRYLDGLRPYSSDTTLYDLWRNSAVTFGVLPERWSFEMPDWLKAHFLGATMWQWISILFIEIVGVSLIFMSWHIGGRLGASRKMRWFITSVFVVIYSLTATTLLGILQIGGNLLYVVGQVSVVLLYVSAIWVAFAGANAIAEEIIKRQRLRRGGVDSQLIRLGARLIAQALTILFTVRGTSELELPAYSLLTGLGVSGLAIALAARDTLSNLLGSITIMFEKPFRSHDWIKVGDAEGTVERVGFRSTRIRTFEASVISIPNNHIVNTMVDNLGARGRRRQQFIVELPYGTRRDTVCSFINDVRVIVVDHLMTSGQDHYVHLNQFNESGMGVLIHFHLCVLTYELELGERESILLDILTLAEEMGIKINSAN
ncbi:MAG: mechanosensitive ion channel domain-containing protein [Paracoccaceae bacterium]